MDTFYVCKLDTYLDVQNGATAGNHIKVILIPMPVTIIKDSHV